jgi:hypothetical protein
MPQQQPRGLRPQPAPAVRRREQAERQPALARRPVYVVQARLADASAIVLDDPAVRLAHERR